MRDVHIELAQDISIFVGANNSGKTSATQAIRMFLSGSKSLFSLFDFSSHTWRTFDDLGNTPGDVEATESPIISLDLWFEVTANDLYLVIPLLPSTSWQGTQVGVRIEFGAKNTAELLQKYRTARLDAQTKVAAMEGEVGDYVPWPKSLSDFLQKEMRNEFEFRYYVLDRAQFDTHFVQNEGYQPLALGGEQSGASVLNSLMRVDFLNAQRHLADPSASTTDGGGGRSENLSKRLSRFYQRNLNQRQEDHTALKALFDSEIGLNKHLADVFNDTLKRLEKLGYPGLNNPRLEIKSALNPASIMSQDARIHYVLGDGDDAIRLPDSYNGLGFKNLIYMVVEILDLQGKWAAEEELRPPLHLVFIEEPEAHLHAQLQQVFIRNVLELLKIEGEEGSVFHSQTVVTTHSPHILYERGFKPIRYFRRHAADAEQTTEVLNLSSFYSKTATKDRDFLQRYLKLTHCDLFFADAAILVEGNVERLLLPEMIEKEASSLRSACLCILEVGGAFGHRFKSLIQFLGLVALIITDIDSVTLVANAAEDDNEDDSTEFDVPGEGPGVEPQQRRGKACVADTPGAVTSNQTLIQWLPKKQTVAELLLASAAEKTEVTDDGSGSKVRVAYQISTNVEWAGSVAELCGRTLEEAFGLENTLWCQSNEQRHIGLKLRGNLTTPTDLATGLHKRVTGKGFDKTKFALGVLAEDADSWHVPVYIKEGLVWLQEQIPLEVEAVFPDAINSEVPE